MSNVIPRDLSRNLTYILRHGAKDNNIPIRSDGFIKYTDLILYKNFNTLTVDILKEIVINDKKTRFTLIVENNEYYIRANQGHSEKVGNLINDDELLKEIIQPITCIHATYDKYIDLILKDGLLKMKRKHIHFAESMIAKSGKRFDADTYIYINMKACLDDGMKFYRSDNDVILSSGFNGVIPPKYFEKIERIEK